MVLPTIYSCPFSLFIQTDGQFSGQRYWYTPAGTAPTFLIACLKKPLDFLYCNFKIKRPEIFILSSAVALSVLVVTPYTVVTDKGVITDNGDPNTGVITAIEKEIEPIEPLKHCSDEGQCQAADEMTSQYNYNDITPALQGLLHNLDKM